MAPRNPRRRADVLDALSPDEGLAVLRALLRAHPELLDEARQLATDRMVDVDRDAVAQNLVASIGLLGLEELNARTGRHRDGYTEPTEAAWEILEEAVAPFVAELERLLKLSLEEAAREQCEGVLLHQLLDRTGPGGLPDEAGLLGWAPDFLGVDTVDPDSGWLHRRRVARSGSGCSTRGSSPRSPSWQDQGAGGQVQLAPSDRIEHVGVARAAEELQRLEGPGGAGPPRARTTAGAAPRRRERSPSTGLAARAARRGTTGPRYRRRSRRAGEAR